MELADLQKGDVVRIRTTILNLEPVGYEGALTVCIDDGTGSASWVASELIECVLSRTIRVGTRVRFDGVEATVIFSDEKDVVIRADLGGIHSGPADGEWVKRLEAIK